MMYTVNPGYTMTPFPVGGPVAVPMQAGGGMVAMQTVTPESHERQPQIVIVPVSGALGYPPHLVQDPTSEDMTAVYQPQQVETPESSRHGGYTRLTNEQVHV